MNTQRTPQLLLHSSLPLALLALACNGPHEPDDEDTATARQRDVLSCPTQRSWGNRPDDHAGAYQVQAVYVLPKNAEHGDEWLDINGSICNSVNRFGAWFSSQTTDGASLRLDTFDGGILDILFVQLDKSETELMGTTCNTGSLETDHVLLRERIEAELENIIEPNKLYAVYYGGKSPQCGAAAFPPTIVGQVVAMYLKGATSPDPQCIAVCPDDIPFGTGPQPAYLDYGMVHELVHSLGFVPTTSPHQHSGGHVCDPNPPAGVGPERDLMYFANQGLGCPEAWNIFHPNGLILDVNHDDYYNHSIPGVLDLKNSTFLDPLPTSPEIPPGWTPPPAATSPCDALCSNPVSFAGPSYFSGNLGTGPACHETLAGLSGTNCGNFSASRPFHVNGVAITCNGGNITMPPPRNGGYCFEAGTGNHSYAYFSTW